MAKGKNKKKRFRIKNICYRKDNEISRKTPDFLLPFEGYL